MKPDEKDKDQGEHIPQEPNYDYKKIVEDFESCILEVHETPRSFEEIKERFLEIKRKYMLLK